MLGSGEADYKTNIAQAQLHYMEHPKNVYFDLNKALEYIEKYAHYC